MRNTNSRIQQRDNAKAGTGAIEVTGKRGETSGVRETGTAAQGMTRERNGMEKQKRKQTLRQTRSTNPNWRKPRPARHRKGHVFTTHTRTLAGKGFSTGGNQGGQSIESNQTTAGAQLKNNHTNPFKNNRRDGVTEPATQNTQKDGAHWTQTRTAATE
jgi:hypothetical protein